jgi:hypothetical protein
MKSCLQIRESGVISALQRNFRRCRAWAKTRHGSTILGELGFPACLLIAYLDPTVFWSSELPPELWLAAPALSLAGAALWLSLGWGIFRLRAAAAIIALSVFLAARTGHLLYAMLGSGQSEGRLMLITSVVLLLLLAASAYGEIELKRRLHSASEPF